MDKSLIHFIVGFPTHYQTAVVSKPRHRSFNFPSMPVAAKRSAILNFFARTISWRYDQINAAAFKICSQTLRVVSFIADQTLGLTRQFLDRCLDRDLFMGPCSVKGHCQRNSFAVRHHHKLRTLATPGIIDFRAPFLATIKWPSIKHWLHWMRRRLSNSLIKLSQIFSQTPRSSQSLKRLQQVLGLGYSLGKSFHRAPLRNIQKIPSSTSRFFFQGRPLLFNFGSRGSIFFHCFSLKYIARLIRVFPPMSLLSTTTYDDL